MLGLTVSVGELSYLRPPSPPSDGCRDGDENHAAMQACPRKAPSPVASACGAFDEGEPSSPALLPGTGLHASGELVPRVHEEGSSRCFRAVLVPAGDTGSDLS